MTARGYLTRREQLALLKKQRWRCACSESCGQPLWPGAPVRWDHRPPFALTQVAKPNQGVTPHCHDRLTGKDRKDIDKAKDMAKKHDAHLAKMEGQQPPAKPKHKIPSRPFPSKEERRQLRERYGAEKGT